MDTKECVYCNEIKPLSEFNVAKKNRKHMAWCKVCGSDDAIVHSPMPYKECSRCHEVKPSSEYLISKHHKGGLSTYCKPCATLHFSEYGKKNRKRLTKQNRKHMEKYLAKKYKEDPEFAFGMDESAMIKNCLNYGDELNSKYLGCSIEELKDKFNSQLPEGITWATKGYKTYHIDHIIPKSFFNYYSPMTEEDKKICYHHSNLQLLRAKENMGKGSWYNGYNWRKNTVKDKPPETEEEYLLAIKSEPML